MFEFKDFNRLTNGIIDLKITYKAYPIGDYPAAYYYKVYLHKTSEYIGNCGIRLGNSKSNYYIGNIEYEIFEQYQGNNYAQQACEIMEHIAKEHGMNDIYITCQKNNIASIKTIEKLGGTLIEYAKVPKNHRLYSRGIESVNVYNVNLERGKTK